MFAKKFNLFIKVFMFAMSHLYQVSIQTSETEVMMIIFSVDKEKGGKREKSPRLDDVKIGNKIV